MEKFCKGSMLVVLFSYQFTALALGNGGGKEPPRKTELKCIDYIEYELEKLKILPEEIPNSLYLKFVNFLVPKHVSEEEFQTCMKQVQSRHRK
tara:strand:+ start:247 stop:525 length:279 start_codon:yes stop_codon:yes gene_type:complete